MRALVTALVLCSALPAQPPRPRITGVAHAAFYVHDVEKARAFYTGWLGYVEPYALNNPNGKLWLFFMKINDRQYLELFPGSAADRLSHWAVETDDVERMRQYLASRGLAVPSKCGRGRTGTKNFTVKDPDGHGLEFVEYPPESWSRRDEGKYLGANRISAHMTHVGILVGALDPAIKFYGEVLGFRETWRGSRDGKQLNWVNMRVPDGTDYVEFMLYRDLPAHGERGSAHHICLESADIAKSLQALEKRPGRGAYTRPLEIRTGINRQRQLNLFDPDGTRAELMEPSTVDGKPAPSSGAAPPR
jgi:catechol 2,3-dioxygenase-like lactoylglutathione lyase family enzyme